ncbi:MAG TPA: pentapeptide repeat-containing protein, partial [Pirellulales bacterium]
EELYRRLAPTPDEALAMLQAGADALARWNDLGQFQMRGQLPALTLPSTDLRGLQLVGFPFLIDWEGVDCRGADLSKAVANKVEGANFNDATLAGARFGGLARCTFVGAQAPDLYVGNGDCTPVDSDFTRAQLSGSRFEGVYTSDSKFIEADLSLSRFVGGNLIGADFAQANLHGAALLRTTANGVSFARANLSCADLTGSSFTGADFRGADLTDANLFDADFTDARLDGANLTGANVSRAKLTPDQLASAIGRPAEKRTFQPGPEFLKFEESLQGQYVAIHFKVSATDGLHHVTFNGHVTSPGASRIGFWVHHSGGATGSGSLTLSSTSPAGAFAELLEYLGPKGTLLPDTIYSSGGKKTDVVRDGICEAFGLLVGTQEERAAAQAADRQRRADLKKTMLAELKGGPEGVAQFSARPADDFRKMDHFAKADLRKATLGDIRIMGGLIFNAAKFDEASFDGAEIAQADMRKATFNHSRISRSKIAANLTGASFKQSVLAVVDFARADLSKTDFTGATLTDCRFTGASLRGAELSNAALEKCDFQGAQYDEQTLLPPGLETENLTWVGQGLAPHELAAEREKVAAAIAQAQESSSGEEGVSGLMTRTRRRDEFMSKLKQNVDKAKIDKALKMLKAERFELFVDVKEDHLVGVVKSQSDPDLVYACRLASDGSYQCCTQNLNVCGGLRGTPCKHLLVLAVGLERSDAMPPETLGLWIASSRNRQTPLDKEKMGEVLLRYKSAQVGEVDWRPTETTPEDFYAF